MSETIAQYAAMITTIEDNPRVIILESINENTVQKNAVLTSHPTVLGDNIADHMYREPISFTLSGTFGLNGSKGLVIEGNKPSIIDMQEIFEELQDKGIQCSIVKIKIDGNENRPSFKIRNNMVLTSIGWTEKINSLGFNFTFTQALQAEVQEYVVDNVDDNLPSVNFPNSLSFTDALIDWEQVDASLTSILLNLELMTEDFLTYLSSQSVASLVALGVGAAVAVTLVAGVCASVPVVGWIIGAVIAAGIMIYGLVKRITKFVKGTKYRIKAFEKYEEDRKTDKEVIRYSNFVGEIHKNLEQLNSVILVKQISSNEEQEAIVSIGNYYYEFAFLKNNTTKRYSLRVEDIEKQIHVNLTDITTSPTSWSDCTGNGCLFRAIESGEYVYLVYMGENTENERNDLTNYFIVVSGLNPDLYNDTLDDILKNSLRY